MHASRGALCSVRARLDQPPIFRLSVDLRVVPEELSRVPPLLRHLRLTMRRSWSSFFADWHKQWIQSRADGLFGLPLNSVLLCSVNPWRNPIFVLSRSFAMDPPIVVTVSDVHSPQIGTLPPISCVQMPAAPVSRLAMPQSVLHTTVSAALTIFSQLLLLITTFVMTCCNASQDEHQFF